MVPKKAPVASKVPSVAGPLTEKLLPETVPDRLVTKLAEMMDAMLVVWWAYWRALIVAEQKAVKLDATVVPAWGLQPAVQWDWMWAAGLAYVWVDTLVH